MFVLKKYVMGYLDIELAHKIFVSTFFRIKMKLKRNGLDPQPNIWFKLKELFCVNSKSVLMRLIVIKISLKIMVTVKTKLAKS
jgi:hypothetical protein